MNSNEPITWAEVDTGNRTTGQWGLRWLCGAVFLLTALPRLRVLVAGVPFYAVDLALAATFYCSLAYGERTRRLPFGGFIKALLLFTCVGELWGAERSSSIPPAIYMICRFALAVSLFFSVNRIVDSIEKLEPVLKAAVASLVVTSGLMILTSLPGTRELATSHFFSNAFLEPAAESVTRTFGRIEEGGIRGRSLVGVSTLSGAFIVTLWPLAFLLFRWPGTGTFWKGLALAGCLIAPFGAVMTYSRSAILGLALIALAFGVFGAGGVRRFVIVALSLAYLVFDSIGWDSELFLFERLKRRTMAAIENPYEDPQESERILSYVEPFGHLMENPEFLFLGRGRARGKTAQRGEISGTQRLYSRVNRATHSAFSMTYYTSGMIAAFCNVFLVMRGFLKVLHEARSSEHIDGKGRVIPQVMLASLVGMLPWWMFAHGSVSAPRGAMFFFLVFGLIAVVDGFGQPTERA